MLYFKDKTVSIYERKLRQLISLLKYAQKYRFQMIIGPVFKLIEAIFELFLPL